MILVILFINSTKLRKNKEGILNFFIIFAVKMINKNIFTNKRTL